MNFINKLGKANIFLLFICALIIVVAEYLFISGEQLHGIFIGLWAPMIMGLMILFKLVDHGSK